MCLSGLSASAEVLVWLWLSPCQKLPAFTTAETSTQPCMRMPLRARSSVVYNWTYGTFYVLHQMNSSSFGLEPPMHRPGWNWTHKCSPCIGRYLTNFIQIGRHMGDCRPKTCFWHIRLDNHAILSGKILSGWYSVGGHYLQGALRPSRAVGSGF